MIYCQKCGKQIEKYWIIDKKFYDLKVCKDCKKGEKVKRKLKVRHLSSIQY